MNKNRTYNMSQHFTHTHFLFYSMPTKPREKKAYYCYLIVSLKNGRTYIGYSSNPHRRLREHNGEIKGGAKSTRAHRPYRLHCIVGTFSTIGKAMSFEYNWKHKSYRIDGRVARAKKLITMPKWKKKELKFM